MNKGWFKRGNENWRRKDCTPPEHRFWRKVKIGTLSDCWIWGGSITGGGYGQYEVRGTRKQAHRYAYELFVGPIPEGLTIDHLCRTRPCVNPRHLEPVSLKENILRGIKGLRGIRNTELTHCRHGHLYDEANTYHWRNTRICKTCLAERGRRRYQERKLQLVP